MEITRSNWILFMFYLISLSIMSCQICQLLICTVISYRNAANKPSWLPEGAVWAGPSKQSDSREASQMSHAEFIRNEKRVLTAAYVSAGYDPASHISEENCLDDNKPKTASPFIIPLTVTDSPVSNVCHGRSSRTTTTIPAMADRGTSSMVKTISGCRVEISINFF